MPKNPVEHPEELSAESDVRVSAEEVRQLREYVQRLQQEQTGLRDEQKRLGAQLAESAAMTPPQNAAPDVAGPTQTEEQVAPRAEQPRRGSRLVKWLVVVVALAALLAGGWFFYARLQGYESTDDAQVDGHMNSISPRVDGTLARVYVEDNQFVKAGQMLTELDAHDYQAAVELARANLAQAQAQVRAESTNVPISETTARASVSTAQADVINAEAAIAEAERDAEAAAAKVREAEANNAKAQADLARYKMLVDKDEVSRQEYDQAVAAANATAATVQSYRASASAARHVIDQRNAQLAQSRSRLGETSANAPRQVDVRVANVAVRRTNVEAARAQLEQALLNLSYCKIVAPVSGIVTRKSAEVGQRVSPGQQLLYVVQTGDLWVTANFKETQLSHIRPGQPASLKVDALQRTFDGYVESISGATGARTSLLPPENATGNFVKVVQRLPVRLRFKAGQTDLERLRPGMSVTPKVKTK